jgi:hypothetical protein
MTILISVTLVVILTGSIGCSREAVGISSDVQREDPLNAEPSGPPQLLDSLIVIDGPGWIRIDSLRIDENDEETPGEMPDPETLMAELAAVYQERDADRLEGLLSSDFRFYPAHVVGATFPSPAEVYWNKETEIDIHRNLFDLGFLGVGDLPRIESVSVTFTCLAMRQASYPRDDAWILDCRGEWELWSLHTKPKPFGYRHVSEFTLVVAPQSEDASEWAIKLWRERPGVGWLLYAPAD